MSNQEGDIFVDSKQTSSNGLSTSKTSHDIKFFSGKSAGFMFSGQGDIIQIIKGALAGDKKSLVLFTLMMGFILLSIAIPLTISFISLYMGNTTVSYVGFIFAFLVFLTILRNIYASYKRNKN